MIEGLPPFSTKPEIEVPKAYAANERPPFRAPLKLYSYGIKEYALLEWIIVLDISILTSDNNESLLDLYNFFFFFPFFIHNCLIHLPEDNCGSVVGKAVVFTEYFYNQSEWWYGLHFVRRYKESTWKQTC